MCGALHFTEPRVVLAADYELINLSIMVSVQSSCNKRFICDDLERTSAGWDGEFVIHYCFSIIIPSSRPSTLTLEPKAGWLGLNRYNGLIIKVPETVIVICRNSLNVSWRRRLPSRGRRSSVVAPSRCRWLFLHLLPGSWWWGLTHRPAGFITGPGRSTLGVQVLL